MKKIIIVFVLSIFLVATSGVSAQTTKLGSTSSGLKASVEQNLIENLRQRAKTEITRRLNFLNELLAKLTTIKKISDTDKVALQNQIQAQIDGLNALQTKIDQDTDITTLRTDVKSIINGYYIFAFFRVKVSLLFAADRLTTVADSLSALETKLKTRVDEAAANGEDVAGLNTLLSDMTAKISDAKLQIQTIQSDLASQTAQGFPGNKSVLLSDRTKLKTAAADLKAAYQDAIKIRQGLGKLGIKINNSGSNSATVLSPTPTP